MRSYPYKEPKPEAFASAHTGEHLEALSGVAASQDYESSGPWLSTAAQDLLFKLAAGNRPGRFGLSSVQGALDELIAAELATSRGRLSEPGRLVTSALEDVEATFTIVAGYRGASSSLQCVLGSEGILVLAGASCRSLRDGIDRNGVRQIDFLSLDQLCPALAAWLGIGPGWPLDAHGTPTLEQIQMRMEGAGPDQVPVPPDADPVLRNMWEQDWFMWQWTGDGAGLLPTGIHAGPAGLWELQRRESGPELRPWPSGNAYRALQQTVYGLLLPAGAGGRSGKQP